MGCAAIKVKDHAEILSRELASQLDTFSPNLLKRYPVDRYCNLLKKYPKIGTYKYISKDTKNTYTNIIRDSDASNLEIYHKLVVLNLLSESSEKIETIAYPEEVKKWYLIHFESILERILKDRIHKGSYLFPHDRLFKDIGICTLKLIPTGVRKLHLEILPVKRFLFANGLNQLVRGLLCILFELKGIQPLYHGHLDSRDRQSISEFSFEGWVRHYKMVADLLKIHRDIKGVMGLAWFYDPQLKKISPKLAYLRELVADNGGSLFYVGATNTAAENATRMSMTRKRLYDEGKYTPTSYLYIWSRTKIIQWAENS